MPEERNRVITDHLVDLAPHPLATTRTRISPPKPSDERDHVRRQHDDRHAPANEDAALALEAWREFGLEPGGYSRDTAPPGLVDVPDLLARTIAALDDVARDAAGHLPRAPTNPPEPRSGRLDAAGVLTPPLPYRQFLSLEAKAAAVVTDSGGIQEETTALRVPCFTLRDNTERPVTIELGTNTLLGLEPERFARYRRCLADRAGAASAALGRACRRAGGRGDRTPRGRSHRLIPRTIDDAPALQG